MPEKSRFQIRVEETLGRYIDRFVRYAGSPNLPPDHRELLAGTFLYLLDEDDLVPDQVPNIGYLDDLMVFVAVARHLVGETGGAAPTPPAIGLAEPGVIEQDRAFLEKNKGLLFARFDLSIDTIRQKGREAVAQLDDLCRQIQEKYPHLGRVKE
ncbi:MAG: DUF1232 domain-containing protein [Candidatus Riflebacteria bacterium]|nr:DUF1232 domain-containing protein [Candidatus Riflebacteria bacterium]